MKPHWHNPGVYAELLNKARLASEDSCYPKQPLLSGAAGLFLDVRGWHLYASGGMIKNSCPALDMCAERVTMFNAVSQGYQKLVALAIVHPMLDEEAGPESRMPCGACLQVLAEFSDRESIILVHGVGNFRLEELLPKPYLLR